MKPEDKRAAIAMALGFKDAEKVGGGVRKPNLIGEIGEFVDRKGNTCQCVVRGYEEPPFSQLLIVDYVTAAGEKICGANIGIDDFIADSKTRPKP